MVSAGGLQSRRADVIWPAVTADPDYALELLQRAADLNEPYALYVLGGMYLEGYFVEPDIDLSLNYLSRAAYFGCPTA